MKKRGRGWHIGERRGELFKELPQSTCVKLSSKGGGLYRRMGEDLTPHHGI
jgi:hypothetical protein